jgi:hypothetical protein
MGTKPAKMKLPVPILTLLLLMAACSKQTTTPDAVAPANSTGAVSVGAAPDTSWVTVQVNGVPMTVTTTNFSRCSSTFNFSAGNSLQRLDTYCFYFYGTSMMNYQYSDSINYSTRPDTASPWTTITASNSTSVYFTCCGMPVTDSVINGNYTALFSIGAKTAGLSISGDFHGIFQ